MSSSSGSTSSGPVLGLSFDYHDAAAALVVDGLPVAAAAEERFSRIKHDPALPVQALRWCLEDAGVEPGQLGAVAFYEKPMTKLERILAYGSRAQPRDLPALVRSVGRWGRSKLWVAGRIEAALAELGHPLPELVFAEHHLSHAASAFYPSPFERAAVLTFDGVGEWATSSIAWGDRNRIEARRSLRFPDSIGLLYSAITHYCGFDVNDGEYKLMGLAPYGTPRYEQALRDEVVFVHPDGSIQLDLRYLRFGGGGSMASPRLARILGGPPRQAGGPLTEREADLARSMQVIIEDIVLRVARHARELTGEPNACLAGGVALNCVANQRLREAGVFDDLWVQPAAGDDGGARGAALWTWYQVQDHDRRPRRDGDDMGGAFLGPAYPRAAIRRWLDDEGVTYEAHDDAGSVHDAVAERLDRGEVVGWFAGRMEYGPRALGHRSILADPRDPEMALRLNAKVKRREGFRPFAPVVLAEEAAAWFTTDGPRPYMTETASVHPDRLVAGSDDDPARSLSERLATARSSIPAATHVDGTARVQTVDRAVNPELHGVLDAFHRRTGLPVLLNTSFNRAGEPIVCSPADALRCFAGTDIDALVLEGLIITKADLPAAVPS